MAKYALYALAALLAWMAFVPSAEHRAELRELVMELTATVGKKGQQQQQGQVIYQQPQQQGQQRGRQVFSQLPRDREGNIGQIHKGLPPEFAGLPSIFYRNGNGN